jgi:inosine/xanthosine triphosphatase
VSHPLAALRLVAVGSTNPVKVAAARAVLDRLAPGVRVEGVAAASGVPDQPWGDAQTVAGARARARAALAAVPGAELGVGFEGGVVEEADGAMRTCAWAAVAAPDGRSGIGGSLAMPLPDAVAARLRGGEELGHAIDALTGESGTKHRGWRGSRAHRRAGGPPPGLRGAARLRPRALPRARRVALTAAVAPRGRGRTLAGRRAG